MIIELTETEISRANTIAFQRNCGKKNQKGWKKEANSLQNHIFGLKCEIAVAKYLEISIDERIFGKKGDGGEPDLWYHGLGIEVKGRTVKGYDYALTTDKIEKFKADLGILCWQGDEINEIIIAGFITKENFIKSHVVKNYGYGNRLVASPKHFTPIEKLIKEVNPKKAYPDLRVGKLVLNKIYDRKCKRVVWNCFCDCGNTVNLTLQFIKKKRNCGNCFSEQTTSLLNLISSTRLENKTEKKVLKTAYEKALEKLAI